MDLSLHTQTCTVESAFEKVGINRDTDFLDKLSTFLSNKFTVCIHTNARDRVNDLVYYQCMQVYEWNSRARR